MPRDLTPIDDWHGETIAPGKTRDISVAVSETYSSMTVQIPLRIQRAKEPGPVVFVTAALHGDEINGTGAVRVLAQDEDFQLSRGSVILVPVLNLLAFDRHSRYLPDRRDLNRCFPGSKTGNFAARMARTLFDEIVSRSDYGIDLHTAAVRRTNYPNVRADMSDPETCRIAEAFGCEAILNGKGPKGAFRREACRAGCPTIIMEGGEVWKVERGVVDTTVRGIKNVLRELNMLDGEPDRPDYQIRIEKTKWVRADRGGFLHFHVQPGEVVSKGQPLATNTTLLGCDPNQLTSPFDGIILGMVTLPAISPGEPVCHIGQLPKGTKPTALRRQRRQDDGFEESILSDLASTVMVVDPVESESSNGQPET